MCAIVEQAALLQRQWETDPRWAGITRDYSALDVIRLRGRDARDYGLARRGVRRLWERLRDQDGAPLLGAVVGDRASLAAGAGPDPVYLADDSSDAAGDAFGVMTEMIDAGAAGVVFGDLLATDRSAGHPAEKALVPTRHHIGTLNAARLAADVLGVPALIIARTGAHAASRLTSAIDPRDHEFLTGGRTADGYHQVEPGWYACVTRQLEYAPYADLLWLETPAPDLDLARAFACIIHSQYPDKLLAYSCPRPATEPGHDSAASIAQFQRELAALGYRFQSATPAAYAAPAVPAYA